MPATSIKANLHSLYAKMPNLDLHAAEVKMEIEILDENNNPIGKAVIDFKGKVGHPSDSIYGQQNTEDLISKTIPIVPVAQQSLCSAKPLKPA